MRLRPQVAVHEVATTGRSSWGCGLLHSISPNGALSLYCYAPLGLLFLYPTYPRLTPGVIDIASLRDDTQCQCSPIIRYGNSDLIVPSPKFTMLSMSCWPSWFSAAESLVVLNKLLLNGCGYGLVELPGVYW